MYKVKDVVKVINDKGSNNYLVGGIYTISYVENWVNEYRYHAKDSKGWEGNWLIDNNIEHVDMTCTCGVGVCFNCKQYRGN